MVFLTCPVSFRSISCKYFSKWQLKNIFRWQPLPLPSDFDGFPYPVLGGTPDFFIKMTAKDVKEIT